MGRLDDSIAALTSGIQKAGGDVPPGGDASTAIANLRALRTELEAVQELKNARAQALAALESGEFSRSRTLHAHAQAHAHVPAVAAAAAQPAL